MKAQAKLVEYINGLEIKRSSIADAAGMSDSALSKSMRLERKLTIDEFGSICSFLGVSMDTFR